MIPAKDWKQVVDAVDAIQDTLPPVQELNHEEVVEYLAFQRLAKKALTLYGKALRREKKAKA